MNTIQEQNGNTVTEKLTLREATSMMRVCERTVTNWRKMGLPCVKIGRKLWILTQDLKAFMESHRVPGGG